MIITAFNPETEGLEKSYLSDSTSAGVTTLSIKNNNRFSQNDRIMIGEEGREKTEVVTVTGAVTSGTALTVSATTFPHEADDPVYVLRFDQIKFYRSTAGENGTYTLVSTQDLDVDNEDLTTSYDDASGLSTYYYKVSYYNSVSTLESSQSDAMQGTGYERGTVGFLVDEIMREVRDQTEITTDRNEIIGWMNECNDDLQTRFNKPPDFLRKRTVLGTTASSAVLSFPDDFWKLDRFDYVYDDGVTDITYPVRIIDNEEFRVKTEDNTLDEDDQLQYVTIDTAVDKFRLYPTPATSQSGVIYLYYWKTFDQLESDSDVVETPNQRIYKLFCLGKFYRLKGISDNSFLQISDRYFSDYSNETAKLQKANKRSTGEPRSFKFNPQTFKGNRKY